MKMCECGRRGWILASLVAAAATSVDAQSLGPGEARWLIRDPEAGGARLVEWRAAPYTVSIADQLQTQSQQARGFSVVPSTDEPVRNAPYFGDAVTTVTQTLSDGTRIGQRTTARVFRDATGRTRREQTIIGLGVLEGKDAPTITVDPDPGDGIAYQLDADTRTARRVSAVSAATPVNVTLSLSALDNSLRVLGGATGAGARGGGAARTGGARSATPQGQDVRQVETSLGTRVMEGVKATGHRTTTTIPTGQIGNDRPIEITDERWESPELRVLVYSRYVDPRSGEVEYRLSNVVRSEPPADLFVVPPDYSLQEGGRGRGAGGAGGAAPATPTAAPAAPPVPGGRSGGRRSNSVDQLQ